MKLKVPVIIQDSDSYQYSGFRGGFISRLVLEACRVVPSTIFGRYSRTCICIDGSSQKSVCKHTSSIFWDYSMEPMELR